MVALAGAGRALHLAQQRVHFLGLELAARAHRMMAGDGREAMVEPALQRQRAVLGGEIVGEIAQQRGHVGLGDQRRRLAQQDRAGAEAFDDEAELFERAGMFDEPRGGVRIEIDDERATAGSGARCRSRRAGASGVRRRCAHARRAGRR